MVDPAGLCEGLTRWAVHAGARVVKDCRVTDIKTTETLLGGRRVSEVHTPHGVIKTNAVVNATGNGFFLVYLMNVPKSTGDAILSLFFVLGGGEGEESI